MSESMKVQPFGVLIKWILKEYKEKQSIFGIHRSLFYTPRANAPYATPNLFGSLLGAPVGPAAGPHTQLTQNIIAAWLSGARFIELKTVQILDELEIPRPCIDMEDEGYNVEWSQELRLHESISEYIKAWALIHILNRLLGWEGKAPLGTIFNMSVGYNLEGIKTPAMTAFMDAMGDASAELAQIKAYLKANYPQFADIDFPTRLSNNVTLSTMHGCPPDEIEKIARYLLEERGLHTTVKLNPTLLGPEGVRGILNNTLGYSEITVPDIAFEHDLKYDRAVGLIKSLKKTAAERNLTFGVKLSNTLEVKNHKPALPGDDMYMSGRALYPITMNLFNKLAHEFNGELNVSFSAGVDALNIATIVSAGALPVTVASDLLKPGGYSRMVQYLEVLETEMTKRGAKSLPEFAAHKMQTLEKAAAEALVNPRYKKSFHPYGLPRVKSGLDFFDCLEAPCADPCAVHQNVPEYAWLISRGEYDKALESILTRNPLPGVTGYVCTHLCQTKCTQSDYEEPVAIRVLKRVAFEKGKAALPAKKSTGKKVAVIGSGPSGLSAACYLAVNGVQATIFEAKAKPGGMLRMIPSFRLPDEIIQEDIDRITALGVELKLNTPVTGAPEELLKQGFDAVYVAAGFQKDMPLDIEGSQGKGVYSALELLERVRRGEKVDLGKKALVIGGGDTAMDAVRVSGRLTGHPATILYRRTRHEMPASEEELEGAFEEGAILEELVSPLRVILTGGKVTALECQRNRLGEPDASGRRRPVPVEGSEFQIPTDSIIAAIGQLPDLGFLGQSSIARMKNGSVLADKVTGHAGAARVYAGGDVVEGPDSIIAACADGAKAAAGICKDLGVPYIEHSARVPEMSEAEILKVKEARIRKVPQYKPGMTPPATRTGFELIEARLEDGIAALEAQRCLQCATFCDKCVEVCPNRANYTFMVQPVRWSLSRLGASAGKVVVTGSEPFAVTQTRQIIHIDDLCNECGDCATFCMHSGRPYADKARLFFKQEDYVKESDNAFMIDKNPAGLTMRSRENGVESTLTIDAKDGMVVYETPALRALIQPADFSLKSSELKKEFTGEASLKSAAAMYVLLKGLAATSAYLPML